MFKEAEMLPVQKEDRKQFFFKKKSQHPNRVFSYSGVFGGKIVKTRVRDDTDAAPQPGSL